MGYGRQIGISREGYPIYLFTDVRTNVSRPVVVLPDGRALYSDENGRIITTPAEPDRQVGLALVGGLIAPHDI
jgi:hypothetical protein